MPEHKRVVITGVGLTAPNGNNLAEMRKSLLEGRSGVSTIDVLYLGTVPAGVCDFDEYHYQKKKIRRRGTRAGSIAIWCANEAVNDAGIDMGAADADRIGVYLGTTEHGNVETANEVHNLSQFDYDVQYWSHHHNPRTVANNPAGEVSLNLKITGPHYCLGAACAAGNLGLVQGYQMLQLGEVDVALAGGVSESIGSFVVFASFKSEVALGTHEDPAKVSRPFDRDRNGIVVSEGGCIFVLETLERARARGAKIYGEVAGYGVNSDAHDFVHPFAPRQAGCMEKALRFAGMKPGDIDLINTHATSTPMGDVQEVEAIKQVFGGADGVYVNNTKSFIGHCMGAAGALELAGNLPVFEDGIIHPTINVENLDPECAVDNLVVDQPVTGVDVRSILNNSFGMLGLNSTVIITRYEA